MWIYPKYITKNGVRIYPKNANCFRFWVDNDKYRHYERDGIADNQAPDNK